MKRSEELKRHIHRIFNERLKMQHASSLYKNVFLFSNKSVSLFISLSHSPFYSASRIEYLKSRYIWNSIGTRFNRSHPKTTFHQQQSRTCRHGENFMSPVFGNKSSLKSIWTTTKLVFTKTCLWHGINKAVIVIISQAV